MSLLNIINVEKVYGSNENKVQALKNVNIITHDERIAKQCKRIMYIEDGRIREEKKDG